MKVSIITPEETVLTCDAQQVVVPGSKSPFAMLQNHQAIISSLVEGGVVRITNPDGTEIRLRLDGNCIVEQHDNLISILATRATRLQE